MGESLPQKYAILKKQAKQSILDSQIAVLLSEMAIESWRFLNNECQRVEMASGVPGKTYFGFRLDYPSRPINRDLFIATEADLLRLLDPLASQRLPGLDGSNADRAMYTAAISVCAANDVNKVGRKASATFFEVFVGHIVSTVIGTKPRKQIVIPESGSTYVTADFVFDLGPDKSKLHLPVKTSTRERIVQAWVHQLVLDGMFGRDVYRGILVCISETKLAAETQRVTEICVPQQLQVFQRRIATLERIYYLDPPARYMALASETPKIEVRPFSQFFAEWQTLLTP